MRNQLALIVLSKEEIGTECHVRIIPQNNRALLTFITSLCAASICITFELMVFFFLFQFLVYCLLLKKECPAVQYLGFE